MTILQITSHHDTPFLCSIKSSIIQHDPHVQEVQCENFSITQISRELNIGESISAKSAIFNTFGGSHSFLIFAFF